MKIMRITLALLVIALSTYGLITKSLNLIPIMMFSLGVLMVVSGLDEFKKGRKVYFYLNIAVALFLFFFSIKSLFFH